MITTLLLNILLWLLVFVFALIFLILILPITLQLRYEDGKFDFKIKVLFFRVDNLGKWISEKGGKNPKKSSENENKGKKLKDIQSAAKYIKSFLVNSGKIIKMILKSMVFEKFNLKIVVGSEEASKTATNYGAVCTAVYPAASALIACNEPKSYDISVFPDFVSEKIKIFLDLKLKTGVLRLLIVTIKAFKIINSKLK